MLHLTLVKKIVSPCFKERQFLTSTSAGGVALLNEVFPTRFTPQNLMEKLGHLFAFYISAAASKFLFNFVSQKTRCDNSARFLCGRQASPPGLHAPASSTKVSNSINSKYSLFIKSRKLPLKKVTLRLFDYLCYNVAHWPTNPIVKSNITQLHIKQLSHAVFEQWASVVRYTMFLMLCCVGFVGHDNASPLLKGRFLFPQNKGGSPHAM